MSRVQVFTDAAGISGPRLGQFVGIRRQFTRTINKKSFTVAIYAAHDVFGLIGSERNGVVVVNDTDKKVVLDMEAASSSGWYGPTKKQLDVFGSLNAMTKMQFLGYIRLCENFRGDDTL